MFDADTRIVIAGAGSIGCHAGGCLALAGREVSLLARPRIADAVRKNGLAIFDLGGRRRPVAPGRLKASADPAAALKGAGIVIVTVKSGATAEMAGIVAAHDPADALVVSLQNGVANAGTLRQVLGNRRVLAGMVPYNVVQAMEHDVPSFHRTTEGRNLLQAGVPGLAEFLDVPGCPFAESGDIEGVLWGKLLLNLNNALNALSGLPLARELADRRWRRLLASQIAEALTVMRQAGVRPARVAGPPAALLPFILRLPDALFARLARRMLAISPDARSSMWEDLVRRRTTEIDEFQGAIVRLAEERGLEAPLSRRILALVRAAEAEGRGPPHLDPAALSDST